MIFLSIVPPAAAISFPPAGRAGVKICGITRRQQAEDIIAAGADALGFNLWEGSKRFIPLASLREWLPGLKGRAFLVAVVVNASPESLDEIAASGMFDAVQLHGDETADTAAAVEQHGIEVIKALRVRDRESLSAIGEFACRSILLDACHPAHYGGSGETFSWDLATVARLEHPEKKLILAGGLTPDNVRAAIQQTRPAAVDAASGVESSPGIKDLDKVRRFIAEVRKTAV